MNKLKSLALAALATFGLSAYGGTTTNEWWNVTFEPDSFQAGFPGLTNGVLGPLTNDEDKSQCVQPYAAGVWSALDGDESYVTNGLVTNFVNGAMAEVADSVYLKLDTQGNDLTWTADTTDVSNNIVALVDADLLLVGSDSAPDATDFDSAGDVHTAVYLKNETHEDSGETTNSVLCVYVFDSTTGGNYWQELDGVELTDNAWAHVQVVVDYAGEYPEVQVFVNGTAMHARGDETTDSWTVANRATAKESAKLSSVAFRGTGAVDNFVGETQLVTYDSYEFTAEVYMDGTPVAVGNEGNVSRVVEADAGEGKSVLFEGFLLSDYDYESYLTPATWALSKVEIVDPASGVVSATYNFTWNASDSSVETTDNITGVVNIATDDEFGFQTGPFSVTASTASGTSNAVIARVYFTSFGVCMANAETVINGVSSTNSVAVKSATNVVWNFPATQGGAILSTVQVYEGAEFAYADGTATVSNNFAAALAADTLFVTATYTNGTLAAGQTLAPDAGVNGLYTFTVVEGGEEPGHIGAKTDNGFVILAPADGDYDATKPLTFTSINPDAGSGNATATISASMIGPDDANPVTLQLIYRTTLTGADQYVNAVVTDIDTVAGTATVTFALPQSDTLFLIGFRNQTGVVD